MTLTLPTGATGSLSHPQKQHFNSLVFIFWQQSFLITKNTRILCHWKIRKQTSPWKTQQYKSKHSSWRNFALIFFWKVNWKARNSLCQLAFSLGKGIGINSIKICGFLASMLFSGLVALGNLFKSKQTGKLMWTQESQNNQDWKRSRRSPSATVTGGSWSLYLFSASCDIKLLLGLWVRPENYLGHSTHPVFSTESQRSCSASPVGIKLQPLPEAFLRKNPSGCKSCLSLEQLHVGCGDTSMWKSDFP